MKKINSLDDELLRFLDRTDLSKELKALYELCKTPGGKYIHKRNNNAIDNNWKSSLVRFKLCKK